MKRFNQLYFLVVILISFLVVRGLFLIPVFSDETIYFDMAKNLRKGLIPYQDFFYAHPPLQLILLFPFSFSFKLIKLWISVLGIGCLFLTFLISKELFDEKTAFYSSFFFLLFPGFLIFGTQGMGMFEALFFFLMGFYFLLKGKNFLATLFLTLAFFTRYLILLLFPLILMFLRIKKRKVFSWFFYQTAFILLIFLLFFDLFGLIYFKDTIVYHFRSNIKVGIANWIDQYLMLGFFTIFLSLFCLIHAIFEKNKLIALFSAYPLLYDLLIIFGLKQVIYHYFVLPLPFLFLAIGYTFAKTKFFSLKIFILLILSLCIYSNLKSLEFYYLKDYNQVFFEVEDWILKNSNPNDLIFGEPRVLNYVSFVTDRKILNNWFDSDLKFINFYGKEKVLEKVERKKPRYLIVNELHYSFLQPVLKDYKLIKEWNVPEYYHVYLFELK